MLLKELNAGDLFIDGKVFSGGHDGTRIFIHRGAITEGPEMVLGQPVLYNFSGRWMPFTKEQDYINMEPTREVRKVAIEVH